MKKLLTILSLASLLVAGCTSTAQIPDQQARFQNGRSSVTYQTFYNELQPYGNWINYPSYGYVWQPAVSGGFRPYETNGQWVSTTDGWAWASDYNWGWAPFHYGRWLLDPALGWVWVPGYEWAPAWVQWGHYNNYYAWAPLAPGISIGFGNSWMAPAGYWSVIPYNCIYRRNVRRYVVRNNVTVNNITIINNYNSYDRREYYHRGPDYSEVERYTKTSIKPIQIADAGRPGRTRVSDRLEIYKPTVSQAEDRKYAPQKVKTVDEATIINRAEVTRPGRTRTDNVIQEQPAQSVSTPRPVRPQGQGSALPIGENDPFGNSQPRPVSSDQLPVANPVGQGGGGSTRPIQEPATLNDPSVNQPGVRPRRNEQPPVNIQQPSDPRSAEQQPAPRPIIKDPRRVEVNEPMQDVTPVQPRRGWGNPGNVQQQPPVRPATPPQPRQNIQLPRQPQMNSTPQQRNVERINNNRRGRL